MPRQWWKCISDCYVKGVTCFCSTLISNLNNGAHIYVFKAWRWTCTPHPQLRRVSSSSSSCTTSPQFLYMIFWTWFMGCIGCFDKLGVRLGRSRLSMVSCPTPCFVPHPMASPSSLTLQKLSFPLSLFRCIIHVWIMYSGKDKLGETTGSPSPPALLHHPYCFRHLHFAFPIILYPIPHSSTFSLW